MPGGKRYKFSKTEIQIMTAFDDASPGPLHVSNITNAEPPVITVTSTTSLGATGDIGVAELSSVEGMTEADDEVLLYQVINGTTITWLNGDSTGWGTFSGSAVLFPGTMTDWCEVTGLNRQGGSSPEINATSVCSDFEEFEIGLANFGTIQVDFNYAPLTTVQAAMEQLQEDGTKGAIRYSLPRSGGERWVLGFIQQTGEQGQNGSLWTGSMTFRATGKPVTVTPA